MKKWIQRFSLVTIFVLILAALGLYWASGMFHPKPYETTQITNTGTAVKTIPEISNLSILTWNIQFMVGGGKNHFFYDKGTDPFPTSKAHFLSVIKKVAAVIKKNKPDIILLQEVDINSDRTLNIDQLKLLISMLPKKYGSYTCAVYHKVNYLPKKEMAGKINLNLCTISKYEIQKAARISLPSKLNVNFINQAFQLKRAIQKANFLLSNGKTLRVLNTHFSAFSAGTNTIEKQVQKAYYTLTQDQIKGPALLAGDLNLLASTRFNKYVYPTESYLYSKIKSNLSIMFENFKGFPNEKLLSGPTRKQYLTYLPGADHSNTANTALDYFFISKQLKFVETKVLQQGNSNISDHYPVMVKIKLN